MKLYIGTETYMHIEQYLVFSMIPICWFRSMSSINCFCSILSLPTICLMNTCCRRSSTFGLSSKSLIRHLWGGGNKDMGVEEAQRLSWINIQNIWFCIISGIIYHSQKDNKHPSIHTHLQMKSLKSSDQSSGWRSVGGGFLLKEEMKKINGKIRWD